MRVEISIVGKVASLAAWLLAPHTVPGSPFYCPSPILQTSKHVIRKVS